MESRFDSFGSWPVTAPSRSVGAATNSPSLGFQQSGMDGGSYIRDAKSKLSSDVHRDPNKYMYLGAGPSLTGPHPKVNEC